MDTEAIAALDLLSRMRFACGDNGKRMQDELEEYLRGLKRDAERYRWLRDKALDVAACWERGGQQEPWCVIGACADDAVPCSDTELDAAIDAAMNGANVGGKP